MDAFTDHYRTLGVHRDAEAAVIEAAYRALVRRYHPDVNRLDASAESRLKAINPAYAVLSNPARRRAYNATWDAHHDPAAKPSGSGKNNKPPSAKPQPPTHQPQSRPRQSQAPPKKKRPWYVNVAGFVAVLVILRAGASVLSEPVEPDVSRPIRAVATSRPSPLPSTQTPVPPTQEPPTPSPIALAKSDVNEQQKSAQDGVYETAVAEYFDEYIGDESTGNGWGFASAFVPTFPWVDQDTELDRSYIGDSGLVLEIKAPGGFRDYYYDATPSDGRDFGFRLDINETTGWGEVRIVLAGEDGGPEWFFGVDPVANQWFLYRTSDYTSEFFYWIEPRPFAEIAPGPLRSVEARVVGGSPSLWINGVDVVSPFGLSMPSMPGSLVFGMGAGINPYSLTGLGQTFSVEILMVELKGL